MPGEQRSKKICAPDRGWRLARPSPAPSPRDRARWRSAVSASMPPKAAHELAREDACDFQPEAFGDLVNTLWVRAQRGGKSINWMTGIFSGGGSWTKPICRAPPCGCCAGSRAADGHRAIVGVFREQAARISVVCRRRWIRSAPTRCPLSSISRLTLRRARNQHGRDGSSGRHSETGLERDYEGWRGRPNIDQKRLPCRQGRGVTGSDLPPFALPRPQGAADRTANRFTATPRAGILAGVMHFKTPIHPEEQDTNKKSMIILTFCAVAKLWWSLPWPRRRSGPWDQTQEQQDIWSYREGSIFRWRRQAAARLQHRSA